MATTRLRADDIADVRNDIVNIVGGNGSTSCMAGWFVRYVTSGPVGSGPINNGEAIGIQLIR